MYQLFFENFNSKVALDSADEALIKPYLAFKKIRRKQYLLQEGDVAKSIAFVEQGILRLYKLEENGTEHTVQFAPEGWMVSDLFGFLTGEPATYNIDALEDSEMVLISKAAHEALLLKMPKYETYVRLQITGAYIALQRRITSAISLSPEERYNHIVATYPNIIRRVPQHMIASYIGVNPETLSRVRRKMLNRK